MKQILMLPITVAYCIAMLLLVGIAMVIATVQKICGIEDDTDRPRTYFGPPYT